MRVGHLAGQFRVEGLSAGMLLKAATQPGMCWLTTAAMHPLTHVNFSNPDQDGMELCLVQSCWRPSSAHCLSTAVKREEIRGARHRTWTVAQQTMTDSDSLFPPVPLSPAQQNVHHKGLLYTTMSEFFGAENIRMPSIYWAIISTHPGSGLCKAARKKWGFIASEDALALAYPVIAARPDGSALVVYSFSGCEELPHSLGLAFPGGCLLFVLTVSAILDG